MPMLWRSRRALSYLLHRYVLTRKFLTAHGPGGEWRFRFRIEDAIGRNLYKKGDYEPTLTDFVRRNVELEPGRVAFDIGANIGWYSVLLSRISSDEARIYAFEPDPQNFGLLCENLRLNDVRNVVPIQSAVAEADGTMELFRYDNKNTGRHSLLPINSGERVRVETVTLDGFAAKNGIAPGDVGFIKIDVEGYEYPAFKGARGILAAKPTILCEFAPDYMRSGGLEPEEYLAFLERLGYSCSRFVEGGLVAENYAALMSLTRNADLWLRRAA